MAQTKLILPIKNLYTIYRKARELFLEILLPAPDKKRLTHSALDKFKNFASNIAFQFNYGLPLNSGVAKPHRTHAIVRDDILLTNIYRSGLDFIECCCMDGYLSWRFSGPRLKYMFNSITANDIDKRNACKVAAISLAFDLDTKIIHGDMSNLVGRYDICTVLGSTDFLDAPLTILRHIIKYNIKKGGVVYADFRCHPRANFHPRHPSYDDTSMRLYREGVGMPFGMLALQISNSAGIGFINHPEKYTSSLFYRYDDILRFLMAIKEVKNVRTISLEDVETSLISITMAVFAIHIY